MHRKIFCSAHVVNLSTQYNYRIYTWEQSRETPREGVTKTVPPLPVSPENSRAASVLINFGVFVLVVRLFKVFFFSWLLLFGGSRLLLCNPGMPPTCDSPLTSASPSAGITAMCHHTQHEPSFWELPFCPDVHPSLTAA